MECRFCGSCCYLWIYRRFENQLSELFVINIKRDKLKLGLVCVIILRYNKEKIHRKQTTCP